MLAVVDHQHTATRPNAVKQDVRWRSSRSLSRASGPQQRIDDVLSRANRCQLDHDHLQQLGPLRQARSQLARHPRLAAAAKAGERDQPRRANRLLKREQLCVATDERTFSQHHRRSSQKQW